MVTNAAFDNNPIDAELLAASVPELVALINDEIAQSGAIPFARFMDRALYASGFGYYQTAERQPGRGVDFLTAPGVPPFSASR